MLQFVRLSFNPTLYLKSVNILLSFVFIFNCLMQLVEAEKQVNKGKLSEKKRLVIAPFSKTFYIL